MLGTFDHLRRPRTSNILHNIHLPKQISNIHKHPHHPHDIPSRHTSQLLQGKFETSALLSRQSKESGFQRLISDICSRLVEVRKIQTAEIRIEAVAAETADVVVHATQGCEMIPDVGGEVPALYGWEAVLLLRQYMAVPASLLLFTLTWLSWRYELLS